MLKDKKAVIFDLDGTLVDSMWIWPEIDINYVKRFGLSIPQGFGEAMEGMSFTETARYFLDTFPTLPRTLEEVKQDWTEMAYEWYTKKVPLKPGVYKFLENLRQNDIRCGIATSNGRELAAATLKALRIDDFFDSFRTSCEVAAGKPAPDVYLKVADDLRLSPECCLVFEDVPNGILAGRNAGMTVCAVDDDYSRPLEAKKRQLADYYIHSYDDIINGQYEVL